MRSQDSVNAISVEEKARNERPSDLVIIKAQLFIVYLPRQSLPSTKYVPWPKSTGPHPEFQGNFFGQPFTRRSLSIWNYLRTPFSISWLFSTHVLFANGSPHAKIQGMSQRTRSAQFRTRRLFSWIYDREIFFHQPLLRKKICSRETGRRPWIGCCSHP